MDSITQAVLGAAVGETVLGKKIGHRAAIIGAIVGTIPDLDILLTPLFGSVERLSVHRGYSHSILFCLLGALLLSYLMSKWKPKSEVIMDISFRRLWVFNFLALFTHVLLDAFTTYGTLLFLPLSDKRVSFDSVNIVDPVYTIPLIIGLVISMRREKLSEERSIPNWIGIGVSTLYLLFTLGHKSHMNKTLKEELFEQSIIYEDLLTVPVGIGNMNWYGVARSADSLYIGYLSDNGHKHVPFDAFPINDQLLSDVDEYTAERLRWFSQGFYTVAEKDGIIRVYNMQCDMQGVRMYGDYKAPTAFYFELSPNEDGDHEMTTGMHDRD